jgi:hypothetical protein
MTLSSMLPTITELQITHYQQKGIEQIVKMKIMTMLLKRELRTLRKIQIKSSIYLDYHF